MNKNGFELAKVEVLLSTPEGDHVLCANSNGLNWLFTLKKEEITLARIQVTDAAGNVIVIIPPL